MNLSENRKLAWIVFAICVMFSLSFSSERALASLRAQVEAVFVSGAHNDGLCISNDLKERSECAYNIASTASNYKQIDSKLVDNVREASNNLSTAQTIKEKYDANALCQRAVEDLYTAIDNATMTDSDRTFLLKEYKEFQSRADTIKRDFYNQQALKYNQTISAFPANLLARLVSIEQLQLFDA